MLNWLIRGAQVLDGTGADAFPADVGIKDGTIAAVGRLTDVDAAHVLDAQGRTLTPGFLDIHRHTDAALFRPNFGRAELAQGLTTLVGGNCGMSLAPLAGAHAHRLAAPSTGPKPPDRPAPPKPAADHRRRPECVGSQAPRLARRMSAYGALR